ncbi:DUF3833 family protein [Sphingomonas sp. MA1305]|jgi:hypothetical protein|uniref:DUF3833 family protein n=1 Tax=unclassified Sphingomonas TaxID=196159 RepID=UPI0018E01212|nr:MULTISPECIES: DUF3833 family protein [unclassified Sphingomonas]MBI0476974.1 DUF3833 family protein [Sphingomonas sp. MA1305]MCP4025526.1 DUF3833 domain-containing protein [Sphingomonas sp.]
MRTAYALLLALASAACVPSAHLQREQAAAPVFDPAAFFTGRTEGRGTLAVVFKGKQTTLVEGRGQIEPDGTIVLDQQVRRGQGAPSHRQWRLHPDGLGRYAGTLTDASGPVAGQVSGNRLHLSFPMKGGLRAQQWLYLQPGGQVARNRMVVTKFGIAVASLDETITRR